MRYQWDFGVVWDYRYALLDGLLITILLSAAAILTGTILAILLALGTRIGNPAVRILISAATQIVRGVPLLVSLVFGYYLLPTLLGIKLSAFSTAWCMLSLNLAAFAADVLRGSMLAVPRGIIEAGMGVGMTRMSVFWRIEIPEVMRRSLPALVALYISLFKYSSIASVISVAELMRNADLIIAEKSRPLEVYFAVAVLYLAVVLPLGYAARWLERHSWFGHAAGTQ